MNKDSLTRRHFLQKTGMATSAILGISILHPQQARATSPFIRKDIGTLSLTDPILTSYATAVAAMQKLDSTDPTNPMGWQYQASIHGTTAASITQGEIDTWNSCQHTNTAVFNTFFLSWHRMYLYYFERIIRKLSGNANWALPYWNYELTTERQLPAAFRTPPDVSNPLFIANRYPGWNDGTMSLQPSSVSTAIAFPEIPFADFSGQLENTPHGDVHLAVGGLMGHIVTAAQDPIFFLHHCNLDRLWNLWLAQKHLRADPLDDQWRNTPFSFFDENGNEVKLTGCDILRAEQQLGYVYDQEPQQIKLFCKQPPYQIPYYIYIPWYEIWPGPIELPAELGIRSFAASTSQLVEHMRDNPLRSLKSGTAIVLKLSGIEADTQPNVYYEVYFGLPKGETLRFESPSYLGNLSLFGRGVRDTEAQMKNHERHLPKAMQVDGLPSFTFKISRALEAATKAAGSLKDLEVVLVPRGALIKGRSDERRPTATIKIGRAEIGLQQLKSNPR